MSPLLTMRRNVPAPNRPCRVGPAPNSPVAELAAPSCPIPTQVSRYQKDKTNLDFTGARDSEWQWHQLGHMQVCTSLQTDNHASTPPLSFFTGQMPFLPLNQQHQSTEGQPYCNKYTVNMKLKTMPINK